MLILPKTRPTIGISSVSASLMLVRQLEPLVKTPQREPGFAVTVIFTPCLASGFGSADRSTGSTRRSKYLRVSGSRALARRRKADRR